MEIEAKTVKSARRVFEVLEFFNDRRPEASATEIASELGYPQSSTSELLRSLVTLGYLTQRHRLYRLSARVAMLGAWVLPSLFRNGRLYDLMEELVMESGETVILTTSVGLRVRYLHMISAPTLARASLPRSSDLPMLQTSPGKLFLSTLPDDELTETVETLNALAPPDLKLPLEQLMPMIEATRRKGYCLSVDQYWAGWGALCVLVPIEEESTEQLAVGIAGETASLLKNEARFFDIISRAINRHIPRPLHRIRPRRP